MDNQAIIPIGNPDNSKSMSGSDHKESLRLSASWFSALDHDWKLEDFALSVSQICDIAESAQFSVLSFVCDHKRKSIRII